MPRGATDGVLGGTLRHLRESRGATQEDIAYKANITVGSLARIERGQADPSWSTVRAIVEALGVALVDLAQAVERQR